MKWRYFYIFRYLEILTTVANGPLLFSKEKAKLEDNKSEVRQEKSFPLGLV